MTEIKTQEQRLDYLVEAFKADSDDYKDLRSPADSEGKRRILRSLMNIRMPKRMDKSILDVQDEYLHERIRENGIVGLKDIPLRKGCMSVWQGDITRLAVDAIVNAANSQMLGCFVPLHRCIDNAIHSAAGVQLRLACAEMMHGTEEPTGSARMTPGFNLPTKYVIHTVGPIVTTSRPLRQQEVQLASCYSSCLDLADRHGLESIAFCCISTGEFRFPNDRACDIAVSTVRSWMASHPESSVKTVIFNTFKDIDHELYQNALAKD
jgi:O-acetyl-ADP-ribose deacetylase (regulator of RNase III)